MTNSVANLDAALLTLAKPSSPYSVRVPSVSMIPGIRLVLRHLSGVKDQTKVSVTSFRGTTIQMNRKLP